MTNGKWNSDSISLIGKCLSKRLSKEARKVVLDLSGIMYIHWFRRNSSGIRWMGGGSNPSRSWRRQTKSIHPSRHPSIASQSYYNALALAKSSWSSLMDKCDNDHDLRGAWTSTTIMMDSTPRESIHPLHTQNNSMRFQGAFQSESTHLDRSI